MNKDDLLIPRFKVIENYPGSKFLTGEILYLKQVAPNGKYWHQYSEAEPIHLEEGDEHKYPAIFRKLEWWEERKKEDMPMFISFDGKIMEVKKWVDTMGGFSPSNDENGKWVNGVNIAWHFKNVKTLPATQEEHDAYMKTLKTK